MMGSALTGIDVWGWPVLTALHGADELPLMPGIKHLLTLLLILSATWVAVRCTSAVGDLIVHMNPAYEHDWLYARKLETQARFLVRGLSILIVIIGLGVALMTFEGVRQIGASLLASAGIGGIILGFAARPVLGNLLAGVQIALTQPFRIDDVLYIAFVRDHYPQHLPRLRASFTETGTEPPAAGPGSEQPG